MRSNCWLCGTEIDISFTWKLLNISGRCDKCNELIKYGNFDNSYDNLDRITQKEADEIYELSDTLDKKEFIKLRDNFIKAQKLKGKKKVNDLKRKYKVNSKKKTLPSKRKGVDV